MTDNKSMTPEEFAKEVSERCFGTDCWEMTFSQSTFILLIRAYTESIRREALQKAAIAICWRCNRTNEYRNIASDGTHEQIATGNHEWCDARLIYDMMRGLPIDTPPATEESK
jgi:hypothetical protein